MAGLQAALGTDFGPNVFFLSITVDPERDTPTVLQRYAQARRAGSEMRDIVLGLFVHRSACGRAA